VPLFSTPDFWFLPKAVSDGAGGAVVTLANSGLVLHTQRIDVDGNIRWGKDGVAVGPTATTPFDLSADGIGGAYLVWTDTALRILVQHLTADGAPQWPGLVVSNSGRDARILADGTGGAIAAWTYGTLVYAQRVSPTGSLVWNGAGVPLVTGGEGVYVQSIVLDGADGAYFFIGDYNSHPHPARVCRVSGSGVLLWTRTVPPGADAIRPVGTSDGSGGVLLAWAFDAWYAQRLDSAGDMLWTTPGVTLIAPINYISGFNSALVPDGEGGAAFLTAAYSRGMRVSGNGSLLWSPPSGVLVFGTGHDFNSSNAMMQSDGTGGYVALGLDEYSDSLYAQRLSPAGDRLWSDDGMPVAAHGYPALVSVGDGGAMYFFKDFTDPNSNRSIIPMAQRIFPPGPVATLLAQFDATRTEHGIELRWRFNEAQRVESVDLERSMQVAGPWSEVAAERHDESGVTVVLDPGVDASREYFYRLVARLADGSQTVFGPVSALGREISSQSEIMFVSPNPSSGRAQVDYVVSRAGRVRLEVVDVSGRVAATLADGVQAAGRHVASWDGVGTREQLHPGLYFVRLTAPDRASVRKFAVIR
jgi:hypothetical protein